MRRVLLAGLGLSALPTLAALLLVQPASATPAAPSTYDSVSTTAIVAGVGTEGVVGASGGLVTLDGGSARVVASLDGSPSAHVLAAPYEPGGGVRAVIGQVNTGAGEQVLDVPDAEASAPGARSHDTVEAVPGTSAGPLTVVGGSATADASPARATGSATGASLAVVGAFTAGGSTSSAELTVDPGTAQARQVARSAVASLDVAGVLHLSDVVGTASITAHLDQHTARQSLTVGGASVNGQAVTIGNDGVTAAGTTLLPGQTLADATAQADATLKQAGISVRTVGGVARHDSRSARADTGGVLITVTTPGLPVGGVSGNTLTLLVGQAVLTEADTLPAPPVEYVPELPVGGVGAPSGSTTTFVPGTPGTPALPGTTVAPPTLAGAANASYVVAGRRFSAQTALVAFAFWQVLSLGMPTLYALVERRRRLALAGAA